MSDNEQDEPKKLVEEEADKVIIVQHSIPRPVHPGEEPPELPDGKHTLFIPKVKPV